MSFNKNIVLLVGGGSGGHLTPLSAVAKQLLSLDNELVIAHIGQSKDKLNSITQNSPDITQHYEISAGKYRRYHGESWLIRLFDFKSLFLNIRDLFRLLFGIVQAYFLLGKLKPKSIFIKGGYVGVPVGIAAKLRKIPYITHDSDAMVSLANKIIAKNAKFHTTAEKPDVYPEYDQAKTIQVGVPVGSNFTKIDSKTQDNLKIELGYQKTDKLLLVLGGGLGARKINKSLINGVNEIISSKISVVLITGYKLFEETKHYLENSQEINNSSMLKILDFSNELYKYSGASDLIITRAGATNIAEFSAQGKACIVIPNPLLTGGHQSKNAKLLENNNLAVVLDEDKLDSDLIPKVQQLLNDNQARKLLASNLHKSFVPDADKNIAKLLLQITKVS